MSLKNVNSFFSVHRKRLTPTHLNFENRDNASILERLTSETGREGMEPRRKRRSRGDELVVFRHRSRRLRGAVADVHNLFAGNRLRSRGCDGSTSGRSRCSSLRSSRKSACSIHGRCSSRRGVVSFEELGPRRRLIARMRGPLDALVARAPRPRCARARGEGAHDARRQATVLGEVRRERRVQVVIAIRRRRVALRVLPHAHWHRPPPF